jgi:hypothetical protein
MALDMDELVTKYMDQENLHRTEGRRGVENLCQVVRAVGYRDPMYWGQLSNKAAVGDLLLFLEDNPGAIEAMFNWIMEQDVPEWKDLLAQQVPDEADEADEDNESDNQ